MPEPKAGGAVSVIEKMIAGILAEGARNGGLSDSIGAGRMLSIREMTQEELDARAIAKIPNSTLPTAKYKIVDPRPKLSDSSQLTNIVLENPDGTRTGGFVVGPVDDESFGAATDEQIAQVLEFFDQVPDDSLQKPLADSGAQAMQDAFADSDINQSYNSAGPSQQAAADQLVKNDDVNPSDALKKAVKKAFGRQDHARVSAERHEWAYCCDEAKSEYMELFATMPSTKGWTYSGAGAIGTTYKGPEYWQWIRLPDMRKIFWIARRYRRQASKCGGKALWEALGHATKLEYIQDLLKDDTEYLSLRTALIGENNFNGV